MMPTKHVQRTCTSTSPHPPDQQKSFRYSLLNLLLVPVLPFLRQEIANKYHLDKVYDPGNNSKFKQHAKTCTKHYLGRKNNRTTGLYYKFLEHIWMS